MDFNAAWMNRLVSADKNATENKKLSLRARINFDGGEATMIIPWYFKDEDKARDMLYRAWKTYLKEHESTEDSIISIIIEQTESFSFLNHKRNGVKKSA